MAAANLAHVIGFWVRASRGTETMFAQAHDHGLPVGGWVCDEDD